MTAPAASDPSAGAEFGLVFRTARDDVGMTQEQVADVLHLDVAVVSALEDGRFEDLPMRPYARGYVRNYARILGLDADDLARRFDAADAGRPEPSVVVPRHPVTPKSELALRPLALGYAAIVAVLLVALGAVLWTAWRVQEWQFPFLADDSVETATVEPEAESPAGPLDVSPWPTVADSAAAPGAADVGVPPSADEPGAMLPAQTLDAGAESAPDDDAPSLDGAGEEPLAVAASDVDAAPSPVGGPAVVSGVVGELTVVFDDESWVSVDDATGRQLFGDLGRGGRMVTVAGPVPLTVMVGNAPAVRMEFDGESVDLGPLTGANNVASFELGGG